MSAFSAAEENEYQVGKTISVEFSGIQRNYTLRRNLFWSQGGHPRKSLVFVGEDQQSTLPVLIKISIHPDSDWYIQANEYAIHKTMYELSCHQAEDVAHVAEPIAFDRKGRLDLYITEYIENKGTLQDYTDDLRKTEYAAYVSFVKQAFNSILKLLEAAKLQKFSHRDMQLTNILCTPQHTLYIIDFENAMMEIGGDIVTADVEKGTHYNPTTDTLRLMDTTCRRELFSPLYNGITPKDFSSIVWWNLVHEFHSKKVTDCTFSEYMKMGRYSRIKNYLLPYYKSSQSEWINDLMPNVISQYLEADTSGGGGGGGGAMEISISDSDGGGGGGDSDSSSSSDGSISSIMEIGGGGGGGDDDGGRKRVATGFVMRKNSSGSMEVLVLRLPSPKAKWQGVGWTWTFPGGTVDDGETFLSAFLREYVEETVLGRHVKADERITTVEDQMRTINEWFVERPVQIDVPRAMAYNRKTDKLDIPIEMCYFFAIVTPKTAYRSIKLDKAEHCESDWVPIQHFVGDFTSALSFKTPHKHGLAPYIPPFLIRDEIQREIRKYYEGSAEEDAMPIEVTTTRRSLEELQAKKEQIDKEIEVTTEKIVALRVQEAQLRADIDEERVEEDKKRKTPPPEAGGGGGGGSVVTRSQTKKKQKSGLQLIF